jgi:uncharacterized repeat protein (TIGR03837 family)
MQSWDIFCRVVDNFGDIGTCWRLARQLAEDQGAHVQLWIDDLVSFSRLCPTASVSSVEQQVGLITVCQWGIDFPNVDAADVVIEAFACELPETYVTTMARRSPPPVWINLEYLSAEDWVDDCHLLASPHPRLPLTKYFFFPGFTAKTGGLLRERDLLTARAAFDPGREAEFWRRLNLPVRSGEELRVSLFCYENDALPQLLDCWAHGTVPVRVLATPGSATSQVAHWFEEPLVLNCPLRKNSLTVHALPFLSQPDFDRLLWACDVNFVRGEDSFIRAQWAQQPFLWQIYPQDDQAHLVKLDAFLSRYLANFLEFERVQQCWYAWNGTGNMSATWGDFIAKRQSIQQHCKVWAFHLDQAGNLANNLSHFVRGK